MRENWKKIALGLLAAGLLTLLLRTLWSRGSQSPQAAESAPGASPSRTIVVAADRDCAPYSFVDAQGNPAGYDIDLLREIGGRIGAEMDVRLMDWSDCLVAVRSGEADLVIGMDYLPAEYPELLFSIANWNDPFVCFGKKNFHSVLQLYDKRLATIEGAGSYSLFLKPYKLTGNTTAYRTYTEALQSVRNGENDYAVIRYSVGRRLLASFTGSGIRAVGPNLCNDANCIAARRGDGELVRQIDAAIRSLMEDRTLQRLEDRWLGRYIEIIGLRDFIRAYGSVIMAVLLFGSILTFAVVTAFDRRRIARTKRENETMRRLQEYQRLLIDATNGLYEEIYEVDITHNCATGEATRRYFASMGIPESEPYDRALRLMAEKHVREAFAAGYLETFLPEKVLESFGEGKRSLLYELKMFRDGEPDCWMRINARLFYWAADSSVRMISFVENIDAEKRRQEELEQKTRTDALTGLCNKEAMEEYVRLELGSGVSGALAVLDIDDFKRVNDELGHLFGDFVLRETARALTRYFGGGAILGRFGGDEFVAYVRGVPDAGALRRLLEGFGGQLALLAETGAGFGPLTASIGCAVNFPGADYGTLFQRADEALYRCKRGGKNKCEIV